MVADGDGNGLPNWGDQVTLNVSTTATAEPHVDLTCTKNEYLVWGRDGLLRELSLAVDAGHDSLIAVVAGRCGRLHCDALLLQRLEKHCPLDVEVQRRLVAPDDALNKGPRRSDHDRRASRPLAAADAAAVRFVFGESPLSSAIQTSPQPTQFASSWRSPKRPQSIFFRFSTDSKANRSQPLSETVS